MFNCRASLLFPAVVCPVCCLNILHESFDHLTNLILSWLGHQNNSQEIGFFLQTNYYCFSECELASRNDFIEEAVFKEKTEILHDLIVTDRNGNKEDRQWMKSVKEFSTRGERAIIRGKSYALKYAKSSTSIRGLMHGEIIHRHKSSKFHKPQRPYGNTAATLIPLIR